MEIVHSAGVSVFIQKEKIGCPYSYSTKMESGWWCGIISTGELTTEQDLFGRNTWNNDRFFHIWSDDFVHTHHDLVANRELSVLFIHVKPEIIEQLFEEDTAFIDTGHGPQLRQGAPTYAMRTIGYQMLTTQRQGTDRRLFLSGRCYDFVNAFLDFERFRANEQRTEGLSLRRNDRVKVSDAVDIINSRLDNPPTAIELATMLGVGMKKLTTHFKQVHGISLGAFTKEQRLQEAYRMLDGGTDSVSFVAYEMGYNPAHFTTEFKRRFGKSPSSFKSQRRPSV